MKIEMLAPSYFEPHTADVLDRLKRLVEMESPSGDKVAVDRLGQFIQDELKRLGARVWVEKQTITGDHVVGQWGDGQGGILLMHHIDTVHPLGTLASYPLQERDGRLWGPGALDMKAGVALSLWVLEQLKANGLWPNRRITALFTTDEEVGSRTSRSLIERLALQSDLVLCLEPGLPDGSLKTWRKGVGDFEIIARGRAAHAGGDHAAGRNAIEELAHQVLALQAMTDYSLGTTLNVGRIWGGTASNVVPAEAGLKVDLRVTSQAEAERLTQSILSLKPVITGTSLEVRGGLNRPPMPYDRNMQAAYEKAQEIAKQVGLSLGQGGSGGGSDANFVAPLGVPVLDGLGASGNGMHSEREHVILASLAPRAALLAALLQAW